MNDEQLLAEVEDLLRSSPPQSAFVEQENEEVLGWLGRTAAVLEKWDFTNFPFIRSHISAIQGEGTMRRISPPGPAYRGLRTLLYQARHDLRMKTVGPLSVLIPDGKPFDYFDEIRKITEMAREDLLFVDPYMDAEFVSRYLPQITSGVKVRLLTSKNPSSLLPAVQILVEQNGLQMQVRSVSSGLHDRYVFVDGSICYQSGASFKDGAKRSPTTLTQITDAFEAVFQTYQRMWGDAKVEISASPVALSEERGRMDWRKA